MTLGTLLVEMSVCVNMYMLIPITEVLRRQVEIGAGVLTVEGSYTHTGIRVDPV